MKSRSDSNALFAAILMTLDLGAATGAFAAGDPAAVAPTDSPAESLQEVVVTAQKREQNLQTVPLSVQVIGENQLAAAAIENFEDFNRVAPSLLVRTDVTPINSTVAIRGIGTSAFGIGVEPSVAVVVDDVPLSFQTRAFGNMSDISRVEILPGPQSTLYGKSSTAGLINMVTPDPTTTFSGKFQAMGTTDAERSFDTWLSGPLTDTLSGRFSFIYTDFPGTIKNLYTEERSDGDDSINAHGKLVWDPTAALKVDLNLNYDAGTTTNDYAFIALAPNANLRGNAAYPPSAFLNGVVPGFDNTNIYNNYGTGTRYQNFDQSVKVSWDLGGPTLMSISSHSYYFLDDHQDYDYTAVAALDNRQQGDFQNTQWTEELRLVSPGNQAFRYTAGLFYANVTYSRDFSRGPYFSVAGWDATEGSQQEAAFGQFEYDIINRLTLIAGARVGDERIYYTYLNTLLGPPVVNSNYWAGNNSKSYFTYKVGPQFQLTDDIMLFAFHATGHKGETYNLVTGFNTAIAESGPVLQETSSDYELGAKMQFLDRRLTINPTLFTTDYNNFQAQGIEILPNGTTNFELENVGTVRTRGIEIDSSYRASKDFNLSLNGTYLDAAILDYPDAQCYPLETVAEGCLGSGATAHQNLGGQNLFDAPKWKFTADATYNKNLGFIPWVAEVQSSYTYTSRVNYSLTLDPETIQGGYGILNLSAGMHDADDRTKITLFVNNVLDKHYHPDITNLDSTFNSKVAIGALVPRDFSTYAGIRVSKQF